MDICCFLRNLYRCFIGVFLSLFLSQTATSNTDGIWSNLTDWPVLPIHTIVTANGELLSFGAVPGGSSANVGGKDYDVWSPLTNTHSTVAQTNHDYFCSATVSLPGSGDVLITGGDDFVQDSTGNNLLTLYDTASSSLSSGSSMHTGRWYPTATVLSNGEILVTGGTIDFNSHAITPEIYNTSTGWRELTGASSNSLFGQSSRFWYPRVWAAPNGKAFGIAQDLMFWLDPDGNNGNGDLDIIGQLPSAFRGKASSSAVMFAPGKILQVGGGASTNGGADQNIDALKSAVIIDINGNNPVVTPTTDMQYQRHWANATVLPNGKVLVNGGARANNQHTGVAFTSEIWDPSTGQWTEVASESAPRLYHSSAVLLPDGRVFSGGGGNPGPPQLSAQFYTPPYLLNGNGNSVSRPEIQWVQDVVGYGSDVTTVVGTNQDISRVTLVRSSSTTHSFNMDQRFIELNFTQSGQTLSVQTPNTNLIAPPGYYLLSVIDDSGVVSESSIIRLGDYNGNTTDTTIPMAEATSPSNDSVINAGVIEISGIASDTDSGIDRVQARIQRIGVQPTLFWDGVAWIDTPVFLPATLSNNGTSWDLTDVDLTEPAAYRVHVRAYDNAGNFAAAGDNPRTDFTVISVDETIPSAEATLPADGSEVVAGVHDISGVATDADSGVSEVLVRVRRLGASAGFWSESGWVAESTWLLHREWFHLLKLP